MRFATNNEALAYLASYLNKKIVIADSTEERSLKWGKENIKDGLDMLEDQKDKLNGLFDDIKEANMVIKQGFEHLANYPNIENLEDNQMHIESLSEKLEKELEKSQKSIEDINSNLEKIYKIIDSQK